MDAALNSVNEVELDLGSIARNARQIRRLVGPGRLIVASLKSNAHGFGLIEVANTVLAAGADAAAVVSLGDAMRLRQAGVASPIMLYAGAVADNRTAAVLDVLELMPTVLDLATARVYSAFATRPMRCFVKVDVGLQRLGLHPDDVVPFVRALAELPRLHFHGLYTHMHAVAGPQAHAYLEWQFRRFANVIAGLERAGLPAPITLAASSAVLALSGDMSLNAIDPGRLFYGLLPPSSALGDSQFEPALRSLKSRLVQVKPVARPGFVDLAPFPLRPGMRMGIFPLGRSDGIEALSAGYVLVRGHQAPILVRPSLEHTRIDVTDIPDATVGDEVVIIGRQGDYAISPAAITARFNMDPGELAIGLRGSIRRRYLGQHETQPP